MPFHQTAIEWPAAFNHLLADLKIAPGHNGKPCGRVDVDVDADTLLHLNEFEARARHRHVRLRMADHTDCVVGEMNTLIGLGSPSDPTRHVGRVRLSFHDLQGDDCFDWAAEARRAAS